MQICILLLLDMSCQVLNLNDRFYLKLFPEIRIIQENKQLYQRRKVHTAFNLILIIASFYVFRLPEHHGMRDTHYESSLLIQPILDFVTRLRQKTVLALSISILIAKH
ncbi:hypothetical protein BpHYR1_021110 [Brachionus plicatilis]|uniref:Uncharacterized protein n=1 Tax=Brachionus plicatilis TaxID=10195 RepID=A0A3M7SE12_BRAPC|nr:hypothetical protein BpHYR1_021110 [Brachionus plicatilis]